MIKTGNILDVIDEEASVFRCSEVFKFDYLPETIIYRDNEIKSIVSHIRRLKEDVAPSHIEITGGFATGKTTAIKTIFNGLENLFDNVICVHINCQSFVTSYQVIKRIYQKVFNKKLEAELSQSILYEKIMDYLNEKNKILIVALDDYNNIKKSEDLNNLFYSLLRSGEIFDNVKVSLITITNSGSRFNLDLNVQTTYHPVEIEFQQYNFNQMYIILKERCNIGFHHGVINDEIIDKIAQISFDEGNLRLGISLLNHAGEQAELDNSKVILEKHLY